MWKRFLLFHSGDRKALLTLLLLACVGFFAFRWLGDDEQTPVAETLGDSTATAASGRGDAWVGEEPEVRKELFPFDPNTADSTALRRLGLSDYLVRNIYRYRAKGGVFREPRDFARLWGLTQGQYRELQPYIRIAQDFRPAAELYPEHDEPLADGYGNQPKGAYKPAYSYRPKIGKGEHVALNSADTTALMTVPGIGRWYAKKITSYRQRLGGFVDVAQLREIDNFPDSALQYFTVGTGVMRKINLNKATLNEIRRHPYFDFYMARDIVEYRRLRGPLHSLRDLRILKTFSAETLKKIEPYVEF